MAPESHVWKESARGRLRRFDRAENAAEGFGMFRRRRAAIVYDIVSNEQRSVTGKLTLVPGTYPTSLLYIAYAFNTSTKLS